MKKYLIAAVTIFLISSIFGYVTTIFLQIAAERKSVLFQDITDIDKNDIKSIKGTVNLINQDDNFFLINNFIKYKDEVSSIKIYFDKNTIIEKGEVIIEKGVIHTRGTTTLGSLDNILIKEKMYIVYKKEDEKFKATYIRYGDALPDT